MPLDASYDQLLRMLASRGLEWLRQQIEALPDPLPLTHPDLQSLSSAARIAPVLSGLRGRPSPLEVIVARRLTPAIIDEAATSVLQDDDASCAVQSVLAGHLVAAEHPQWQLAHQQLEDSNQGHLADRLARTYAPDAGLLTEAEKFVTAPMPVEALTAGYIDQFARVLMQLYSFGASRPQFSATRVYGDVFATCLRYADWAQRNNALMATAQMTFCLRLIDPDHDIAPMLADVIPYQRPDGSFPPRATYSTASQTFSEGVWSTLMVVAALHICTYRRWRLPVSDNRSDAPLHASRDWAALQLVDRLTPRLARLPTRLRLHAAATMTHATGDDWFSRADLHRHRPRPEEMLSLATRVFGSFSAVRFARNTLAMDESWPKMDDGADLPPHLSTFLGWLRGGAIAINRDMPNAMLADWDIAARNRDTHSFDACCEVAVCHNLPGTTKAIRAAARRIAQTDLNALQRGEEPIDQQLSRLDRLSLLARIFEPHVMLEAAAA